MNLLSMPRVTAPLLFALCLLLPAWSGGAELFWPKEVRPGCLVNYRLRTLPPGESTPARADCSILVLGVSDGKLDLEFTVQGVGNRISVASEGFNPATILGVPVAAQDMTAQTNAVEYKPSDMTAPVAAIRMVWKGDIAGTELIRSAEVPFGLASLRRGDFSLEVVSYSWGEK